MGRLPLLLSVILMTTMSPLGLFSRGVRAGLCSEIISPYGYTCNEYQATTDDGFILGIQNIPGAGVPVLLMHGLLAAGDNWVLNSPQQSLAFILADAGYDVWIGNNRNVQWSGGNIVYRPFNPEYWAWTYDELAAYDLTTLTGFVYNRRGQLFYVGHSQGCTLLLAALTGGDYKNQVLGYLKGAVLLAPAAFVGYITPTLTRAGLSIYADTILPAIGILDFDISIFINLACNSPALPDSSCLSNVLESLVGESNYLNESRIQFYNKYFPQPTSSVNVNHFGQSYRGKNFQRYNKGVLGNLASYGQPLPPAYVLSAFPSSIPLQIWSGGADELADPTDVAILLNNLPQSVIKETHFLPTYGHLDFILGTHAYTDIYPSLVEFIKART